MTKIYCSIILVLFVFLFVENGKSENILYLVALTSPSHHIFNRQVIEGLAARGHNLTVLAPDFDANPPTNVTYFELSEIYQSEDDIEAMKSLFTFREKIHPIFDAIVAQDMYVPMCKTMTTMKSFQQLKNYPDDFHFDLIIYDYTIGPCFLGFAHKFNYPPMVAITAFNMPSYTTEIVGGHHFYAYVAHNTITSSVNELNFFQRIFNLMLYTSEVVYRRYILVPRLTELNRGIFDSKMPALKEIEQRAILALVNTNPVIDLSIPLPPNVIQVGGLHVREPKPLPNQIKQFIDDAVNGVIYFSLGTNVRSEFMPREKLEIFIETMRQMPNYRFLWKYEADMKQLNLPSNVLAQKWLPQADILAHPKTKCFITHSGLLGTQESVWRGVPMLSIPFVFDQHQNALKVSRLGVNEIVEFTTITMTELKAKLLKIINTDEYSRRAKGISQKLSDQKEKPLDRALWWIEWALRNPESDYLTSPTLRLGYFTGNAYDVVIFLFVAGILIIIASYKLVFFVFKCFNSKQKNDHLSKQKKLR